jgi:hypothetical protein
VSKTGGKSGDWHRPTTGGDGGAKPKRKPGERMAGRVGKRKPAG